MSNATTFQIASALACLGWVFLIAGFLQRKVLAQGWLLMLAGRVLPYILCFIYLLALLNAADTLAWDSFFTLDGVTKLFTFESAVLAGWVHYLAFDLFIGAWIADDALARRTPSVFVVPVLLMTFMVGPIGLITYLTFRAAGQPEVRRA